MERSLECKIVVIRFSPTDIANLVDGAKSHSPFKTAYLFRKEARVLGLLVKAILGTRICQLSQHWQKYPSALHQMVFRNGSLLLGASTTSQDVHFITIVSSLQISKRVAT